MGRSIRDVEGRIQAGEKPESESPSQAEFPAEQLVSCAPDKGLWEIAAASWMVRGQDSPLGLGWGGVGFSTLLTGRGMACQHLPGCRGSSRPVPRGSSASETKGQVVEGEHRL